MLFSSPVNIFFDMMLFPDGSRCPETALAVTGRFGTKVSEVAVGVGWGGLQNNVRLYSNVCSPILKLMFAYTQIQSKIMCFYISV